jgi:hypothetical protein
LEKNRKNAKKSPSRETQGNIEEKCEKCFFGSKMGFTVENPFFIGKKHFSRKKTFFGIFRQKNVFFPTSRNFQKKSQKCENPPKNRRLLMGKIEFPRSRLVFHSSLFERVHIIKRGRGRGTGGPKPLKNDKNLS